MREYRTFLLTSLLWLAVCCRATGGLDSIAHPRLLLTDRAIAQINAAKASSPVWKTTDSLLRKGADEVLALPPVRRELTGKRLLEISREALRRMLLLGYSYKTTGQKEFCRRAISELLNICSFTDWHPDHFLDVAEMTTAAAVGYDTFYQQLTDGQKAVVARAIWEKGILPSEDSRYNSWLTKNNNWNQVCNASMAYGAIATYEIRPAQAEKIVRRSIQSIRRAMAAYAPDGAYPEGYSYWGYGTTYNVMLIDALEKCYGNDFSLKESPGFMQTPEYMLHMLGPDLKSFNFGDSSEKGRLNPAIFWFAGQSNDKSLLYNEMLLFRKRNQRKFIDYRFSTLALIWGASLTGGDLTGNGVGKPRRNMWTSACKTTPVALMRTSWDKDAVFLAFKGGCAQNGHAHLDGGSFVLVANGQRWAMDFPRQDYNSLESAGLDIWDRSQGSDRWKVFQHNNLSHNTLTFSRRYQNAYGFAPLLESADKKGFKYAIVELTDLYRNQVKKVRRGAAIVDGKYVLIRDEIQGGATIQTVRWNMLTPATKIKKCRRGFRLEQKGHTLRVLIDSPLKIAVKTWAAKPGLTDSADREQARLVGFETEIPPGGNVVLQVRMFPDGTPEPEKGDGGFTPLSEWKNK